MSKSKHKNPAFKLSDDQIRMIMTFAGMSLPMIEDFVQRVQSRRTGFQGICVCGIPADCPHHVPSASCKHIGKCPAVDAEAQKL